MTEKKIGSTEGILIASIPVVGYWCAFLYELGYSKYFDIPTFFVEVGLVPTMVAIVGLLSVLIFIYFLAETFFITFFGGLPAPLKSAFLRIGFVSSFIVGYAIIRRYTFGEVVSTVIPVIAFFLWLEFIFPLITQRKTKGYLAKLDAQRKTDLSITSLLDIAAQKIGRNLFLFLFILYLLSILAYFSGGYSARFQKDFMVLTGTPEIVVLKKYSSYFVVANFDRSAKSVSAEYKLLPADENLGQFKFERVGPLSPMVPK